MLKVKIFILSFIVLVTAGCSSSSDSGTTIFPPMNPTDPVTLVGNYKITNANSDGVIITEPALKGEVTITATKRIVLKLQLDTSDRFTYGYIDSDSASVTYGVPEISIYTSHLELYYPESKLHLKLEKVSSAAVLPTDSPYDTRKTPIDETDNKTKSGTYSISSITISGQQTTVSGIYSLDFDNKEFAINVEMTAPVKEEVRLVGAPFISLLRNTEIAYIDSNTLEMTNTLLSDGTITVIRLSKKYDVITAVIKTTQDAVQDIVCITDYLKIVNDFIAEHPAKLAELQQQRQTGAITREEYEKAVELLNTRLALANSAKVDLMNGVYTEI